MMPENRKQKTEDLKNQHRWQKLNYQALGCPFEIGLPIEVSKTKLSKLKAQILSISQEFDENYSRFIESSLILKIGSKTGEYEVPEELVEMLALFKKLHKLSLGMITPYSGAILENIGYDKNYSLSSKNKKVKVYPFDEVIEIVGKNRVFLKKEIVIDLGCLGKGYLIDKLGECIVDFGIKDFYVDGSGDTLAKGDVAVVSGLEHPVLENQIIGIMNLQNGALCASGTKRRAWQNFHHIVNPETSLPAQEIIATFVFAKKTVVADALATALFLVPPQVFENDFEFEYLIINKDMRVKRSSGFDAHIYTL